MFTIDDYRCAYGGTSMSLICACVKKLKEIHGDELEINIRYEDKPFNDFKSLFSFVQGNASSKKWGDLPQKGSWMNIVVPRSLVRFEQKDCSLWGRECKMKTNLRKNFKKHRCHYENWTFFSVSFEYYLVKAQSLGVTTPFCVDSPMGLGMTRHDRSKSRGKLTGNLTEGLDGVLGSQLSVKFSSISLSYQ